MVKVKVNGVAKEYNDNITYGELAEEYKDVCIYDIICTEKAATLEK